MDKDDYDKNRVKIYSLNDIHIKNKKIQKFQNFKNF